MGAPYLGNHKHLETRMTMLDYYRSEVQPLWEILLSMRQKGLHVDRARLSATREKLTSEVDALQREIEAKIGWVPNTKSHLEIGRLLLQLGIQPRTTATARTKIDEESMLIYAQQSPPARDLLYGCVDITRRRTQLSTFLNMALDARDFYHPSIDLGHAVTGRNSSEGADEGGPQIHNIPQPLRRLFIADDPETDELTQADMRQAEAMVVAWDAEDEFLINAFLSGKDVHRIRACRAFRGWSSIELPPDDLIESIKKVCDRCAPTGESSCAHSERYLTKRMGHAFAYKMGIRKMLKILREEGIFLTEHEAETIKGRILSSTIVQWQDDLAAQLRKSPWVTTPLGRKREFYGLMDEDLVRKYLSWKAQTTVGEVKNKAMRYLWRCLPVSARMVTETHDSVLINHRKAERELVHEILEDAFHTPIPIKGRELLIPIDKGSGPSWGELEQ